MNYYEFAAQNQIDILHLVKTMMMRHNIKYEEFLKCPAVYQIIIHLPLCVY